MAGRGSQTLSSAIAALDKRSRRAHYGTVISGVRRRPNPSGIFDLFLLLLEFNDSFLLLLDLILLPLDLDLLFPDGVHEHRRQLRRIQFLSTQHS